MNLVNVSLEDNERFHKILKGILDHFVGYLPLTIIDYLSYTMKSGVLLPHRKYMSYMSR